MHKIFCFTVSLFHASTCFEHHVLIIRRSKLCYTASGVVTPVGGRPVHRLTQRQLIANFDVLLTVHLSIFILVINQLNAQNFVL